MKNILIGIAALVLIGLLFLLSINVQRSPIIETFDRTGEVIYLTVHLYDDQRAMIRDINEYLGYEVDPEHLGISVYSPDDNRCTIFSLKPRYIDDERTLTLGHELLHCIYGEVHK